jgi:hypothetical protein
VPRITSLTLEPDLMARRRLRAALTAALLLLPATGIATAQPVGSFDELNDLIVPHHLSPGDRVSVRDTSGHETIGTFADFRNHALTVRVGRRGVERAFTEAQVTRIRRRGGHADTWGIALGAAGGVLATWLAASKYGENAAGEVCGPCLLRWGAFAIPAGAGAGALVGIGIERGRREVLYLAPPTRSVALLPWAAAGGRGVRLAVRF